MLYAPGGETRPYQTRVSLSASGRDWAYYIRKHSSTVRARGEDERELLGLAADRAVRRSLSPECLAGRSLLPADSTTPAGPLAATCCRKSPRFRWTFWGGA